MSYRTRVERSAATRISDCWAMDFMSDGCSLFVLKAGRKIRLLTIVDHFTCESPVILVGQRLRGDDVVDVLDRRKATRKLPKTSRVDNGPEFTSKVLDQWAYVNKGTLDFSRPGIPTDNAFIESFPFHVFGGRVRSECLNENWFLSLEDAEQKLEAWCCDYNEHRPHSALGNLAPREFANQSQAKTTTDRLPIFSQ